MKGQVSEGVAAEEMHTQSPQLIFRNSQIVELRKIRKTRDLALQGMIDQMKDLKIKTMRKVWN